MVNFYLKSCGVIFVALALFLAPGCKKDKNNSNQIIATIGDSAGTALNFFTYDASGNLIRFNDTSNDVTNFYYSGSQMVVRTTASAGTVTNTDSFFYDSQGHLVEVNDYDNTMTYIKASIFTYNADNTMNSVSVNYANPATHNELHNYTYSSGKLTERQDLVSVSGDFKLATEYDFLAYDNKTNPFIGIAEKYLPDNFNTFFYVWSYPNNATSIKETLYDTGTGNITTTYSATGTYVYNSNNLPIKATYDQANTIIIYTFTYQQL